MHPNMIKYGIILVPAVLIVTILAYMDSANIVKYFTYTQPSDGGMVPKFKPMPPLNQSELVKVKMCVKHSESNRKKGRSQFREVHRIAHTYLTQQSLVIEVGGNIGEDASVILRKFKPKQYIILEPVEKLYRQLTNKFRNNSSVLVHNFGLGKENAVFVAKLSGNHDEGTSIFTRKRNNTQDGEKLRIVSATEFLLSSGAGVFEVDLLTINCEGCEFDLLEILTETTFVLQFKHIQFQPHWQYGGIKDPVKRYCIIQQLLSRTHVIEYQYSFLWEMWRRHDLNRTHW